MEATGAGVVVVAEAGADDEGVVPGATSAWGGAVMSAVTGGFASVSVFAVVVDSGDFLAAWGAKNSPE